MTLEQEKHLLAYLEDPRDFYTKFCNYIESQLPFEFKPELIAQFREDRNTLLPFQKIDSTKIYNEETKREIMY